MLHYKKPYDGPESTLKDVFMKRFMWALSRRKRTCISKSFEVFEGTVPKVWTSAKTILSTLKGRSFSLLNISMSSQTHGLRRKDTCLDL